MLKLFLFLGFLFTGIWIGAVLPEDMKFNLWMTLTQCMPLQDGWDTLLCARG